MPELKRHTPETVEECITSEQYHIFPGTTVTVCLLKLYNGHTVLGYSACVHKEDFDLDKGKQVARIKAVQEIWALEEYLEANRKHVLGITEEDHW